MDRHLAVPTAEQQASPWLFSSRTGRKLASLDAYLRRLWKRAGLTGARAHRFRDTFAIRLLEAGATMYDVARLLGTTTAVAERHYAPYVKELQDRGRRIINEIHFIPQGEHTP